MNIPLIEQRAVEAGIFHAMYRALGHRLGQGKALETIRAAAESLGFEAGKAFAATAPGGPSFAHFATIVDRWRNGGALTTENVQLGDNRLSFAVTRCAYLEKYRAMGLPEELAGLISCCRDEPFARGYSPRLILERPRTLAQGAPACLFTFTWRD